MMLVGAAGCGWHRSEASNSASLMVANAVLAGGFQGRGSFFFTGAEPRACRGCSIRGTSRDKPVVEIDKTKELS